MSDTEGLWVRSDVLPTGGYGVSINVGADRAWTLPPDRAIRYATACVQRATEVEHDAATVALLQHVGISPQHAVKLISEDLRPHRPIDHEATDPLRFRPILGVRTGPHLRMTLDGKPAGEVTPADLIDHAVGVLRCIAAADLDAALRRALIGQYGLDPQRAAAVVAAVGEHWPPQRPPRSWTPG